MKQLSKNEISILQGDFSNLPLFKPRIVKIFLSSTFSDYTVERNWLFEKIYPKLRKLCLEKYNIDIIMIDMRWGITDHSTDNNLTTDICLSEIEHCKNESIGPAFITFLSHRYGSRFLKSIIEKNEFEALNEEINKIGLKFRKVDNLFEYCYQKDENNLPECIYKLKTIPDTISGLGFKSMGRKESVKEWSKIETLLLEAIREAAENNYNNGVFNKEQRDSYFISVTETEIINGLFKYPEKEKCGAFFREITDIQKCISSNGIDKYIETLPVTQNLLLKLKQNIKENLPKKYIVSTSVEWLTTEGMKADNAETKAYLETFNVAFMSMVENILKTNHNLTKSQVINIDPEIVHHAYFCNKKLEDFVPRLEYTRKINEYIQDVSNNKPFVIYGNSGSGKTSIIASMLRDSDSTDNSLSIVRFLGTSRKSTTMRNVFISILEQLQQLFHLDLSDCENAQKISDLKLYFINKVEFILNNNPNTKIIIFIDSIDQLTKSDYNLDWFIDKLPKNLKIVYSTLTSYENIFKRLKIKLKFTNKNYLEIKSLGLNEALKILNNMLSIANRKLTDNQWESVKKCLKDNEIYPLHLKLLFNIVSKWTSQYIIENDFYSCLSINDTIKYLFKRLEDFHGKILFSHCIFYLTIAQNGLSENELEDILSIDDDVLTSIFQYHEPNLRRFPLPLWIRIKYDLKNYLTEKESEGLSVITWFHRSFFEASREYYKDLFEKSNERDKILMNIIDYYTEKWNNEPKPYKHSETIQRKLAERKGIDVNNEKLAAYRYTKSQKMKYIIKSSDTPVFNTRKLIELSYYLLLLNNKLKQADLLESLILLNYEFMNAKAVSKSFDFVVQLHESLLNLHAEYENEKHTGSYNGIQNPFDNLIIISRIYRDNYMTINNYPNTLAHELLSKIHLKSELIQKFAIDSIPDLPLIPTSSYLPRNTDVEEDIFVTNQNTFVMDIFWLFKKKYAFLKIDKANDESNCEIHLIDYEASKDIGTVILNMKPTYLQILVDNIDEESEMIMKCLDNFTGGILYYGNSCVYFKSFDDSPARLIYKTSLEVLDMVLISRNCFLLRYQKGFQLIDLKTQQELFKAFFSENELNSTEIIFMLSNLKKQMAYTEDFDLIDDRFLICGLTSQEIKIYRFSVLKQILSLFCEFSIKLNFVQDEIKYCLYDQALLVDNSLHSNFKNDTETVVRFVLTDQESCALKIISVNHESKHSIFNINEKTLEINNEYGLPILLYIVAFYGHKIIIEDASSNPFFPSYYCLYLDTMNKIKLDLTADEKYFITEDLFALHGAMFMKIYKISSDEFKLVSCIQLQDSFLIISPYDLKFENEKLYWRNNDRSGMKRFNYLSAKNFESDTNILFRLMGYLDNDHLLTITEYNDNRDFSVYNVRSRSNITTISFSITTNAYLRHNRNFLIMHNNEKDTVEVYGIKKSKNGEITYEFSYIGNIQFLADNSTDVSKNIQIEFYITENLDSQNNDHKFVVVEYYYQKNNPLKFYYVEHDIESNKIQVTKCFTNVKKLNKDTINGEIKRIFNLRDEIVILFDSDKLYYFDLNENKFVTEFQLNYFNSHTDKIVRVKGSKDLIKFLRDGNVVYLKYDDKSQMLKELCDIKFSVSTAEAAIEQNKKWLLFRSLDNFFIIDINRVRNDCSFSGNVVDLSEYKISIYTFFSDNEYLIYKTLVDPVINVLRLADLKKIACLHSSTHITGLYASDKNISIQSKIGTNVVTYMLIDCDNETLKKQIKEINFK